MRRPGGKGKLGANKKRRYLLVKSNKTTEKEDEIYRCSNHEEKT